MKTRLTVLLLFATAISAFAQFPVKTPAHYPTVQPAAEFHFNDGNIGHYPVTRISKDLVRVDVGGDQTIRMPLTYVNSIKFADGCTLYFDKGVFQFDKLVRPVLLKNESGDALLEGVLKLSKSQTESLMGPELYGEFRKNSRLIQFSLATMMTGTAMMAPFLGGCMACVFDGTSPIEVYNSYPTAMKCVTVGGGVAIVAGVVMAFIGNNGCNRVVATYNNGLGMAYTF